MAAALGESSPAVGTSRGRASNDGGPSSDAGSQHDCGRQRRDDAPRATTLPNHGGSGDPGCGADAIAAPLGERGSLVGRTVRAGLSAAGRGVAGLLVAFACGWLAFHLATRNNDFPVHYHPDESSKASQVLSQTGRRNFNHPLLLIELAQWHVERSQVSRHPREVVLAGRRVSAALAGGAVVALSLSAFIGGGWLTLLVAAPTVTLCPALLVHGHYFKEDTALLFGIAVTWLGACGVILSRRWFTQASALLVLGAGCALAASGKYVGVVVVVPALLSAALAGPVRWFLVPSRVLLVGLATLSLAVWINAPGFLDPWRLQADPEIVEHVKGEYEHATTAHGVVALKRPNSFTLRRAAAQVMPHAWAMAAIGLVAWLRRPRFTRWLVVSASFLLSFGVVLSWNAIPIPRYALPLIVLGYVAAGWMLAGALARVSSSRWRWGLALLAAAVTVGLQYRHVSAINVQFADDSRQRLREWIATSLPKDALILAERYTGLESEGDPWRFPAQRRLSRWQIVFREFAPEYAALDDLLKTRVQYVVVAEPAYERFILPDTVGKPGEEHLFEHHRRFYRELFARGVPVWRSDPTPPTDAYVNPRLLVFRLDELRGK